MFVVFDFKIHNDQTKIKNNCNKLFLTAVNA